MKNLKGMKVGDSLVTAAISSLSLDEASKIVSRAEKKAEELGVKMHIAVVDSGGHLVLYKRMDGAWLGSSDVAIKKAKTAVLFDMNTEELGDMSQPGEDLYGIEVSNGGLITFPGGIPIKDDRGVVGAIGVSGGSVDQDKEVAKTGAGHD